MRIAHKVSVIGKRMSLSSYMVICAITRKLVLANRLDAPNGVAMMEILKGGWRLLFGSECATRALATPSQASHDTQGCYVVQEALLLGLCLLRSGALETRLYDAMMACIERREQGLVAMGRQGSGAARAEYDRRAPT
jgi:hypothetical protein